MGLRVSQPLFEASWGVYLLLQLSKVPAVEFVWTQIFATRDIQQFLLASKTRLSHGWWTFALSGNVEEYLKL